MLDILQHPPAAKFIYQAELPAFALLDRPDAPVLATMRSFFAGVEKSPELKSSLVPREWGNPTVPAILYLVAYGNEDDWHRIAGCDLSTYHAAFLATEVDDPLPLARWLAKHGNTWRLAVMSAALRDDPAGAEGFAQQMCRGMVEELDCPPCGRRRPGMTASPS